MGDRFHQVSERQLEQLARRLAYGSNNEAATTAVIELMLLGGSLATAWGLPPVTQWAFEHPVDGGRIDVVLAHEDGSATLVEAKGDIEACEIARGIGQLHYYAVVFGRPARLVLCSSAPVGKAFRAIQACARAGVQYGFLPSYDETRIYTASLRDGCVK